MAATSFLGVGDFEPGGSVRANAEWASQMALYTDAQSYFYGGTFNKRSGEGADAPGSGITEAIPTPTSWWAPMMDTRQPHPKQEQGRLALLLKPDVFLSVLLAS